MEYSNRSSWYWLVFMSLYLLDIRRLNMCLACGLLVGVYVYTDIVRSGLRTHTGGSFQGMSGGLALTLMICVFRQLERFLATQLPATHIESFWYH